MRSSRRVARAVAAASKGQATEQLGGRLLRKQEPSKGGIATQAYTRPTPESHWAFRPSALKPVMMQPESLDTKQDRVTLLTSELKGFKDSPRDAELRNLTIPPMRDGRLRLSPAEAEKLRMEFLDYFHKTYSISEKLHEMFTSTADLYQKHERLRHPPIFYLGHTASFYVNKLHLGKFIARRIDPELEMQMAVGVDEMSWDDLDSNSYVWPSGTEARADTERATAFLQKVMDYRRDVRVLVDELIRSTPMEWPIKKDSFWWVITMCIEHERIHLETSSVIHRQAPLSSLQARGLFPHCSLGRFDTDPDSGVARSAPPNRLLSVQKGHTRVGRSWENSHTYGWDNEFGVEKQLEVPAFAASEFLVSNREFLEFVRARGYQTERFWSEEGRRWVRDMGPRAPRFWVVRGGEYHLRTLTEEVPMPWDWPVEVCHHEAVAFCNYLSEKTQKSLRLPTEAEYLRLRDTEPTDLQDSAHGPGWGKRVPGNVNLAYWASPCPVDLFKSPAGFHDVLGNVWQHSATDIDVLDGFVPHPLYDDFTTPTVDGLHARIMGGSFISTGANGATRDSRYGFRRHFYQHAGFRYVESESPVVSVVSPYEKDRQLCDLFCFHFDDPTFKSSGANFHVQLANTLVEVLSKLGRQVEASHVLELGCGPGRTTLELAKHGFQSVHGADRTAKSFQGVVRMLEGGKLRWKKYLEGEQCKCRAVTSEDVGMGDKVVHFHQTPDFAEVDTQKLHDFDLLVVGQPGVLGSLADPLQCLASLHRVLRPGGILAIGTQYEWHAGAAADAGFRGRRGEEVLMEALRPWFQPIAEPVDVPFEVARTARMFETGVQHITFWERRSAVAEEVAGGGAASCTSSAAAASCAQEGQDMYESEDTVGFYLDFHYGPRAAYPVECAARCIQAARELGVPLQRALEVGSGPGRAAIELSKVFDHVDAGDYSQAFVDMANKLLQGGSLRWRIPVDRTGGLSLERDTSAVNLGVGQVSFSRLDAHALPEELTGYDLICGFNLIDRLMRPLDFLRGVKARLNPGGLLVISSPYTWREDFTPKENWLGGFKYGDNDGPSTYEGLKSALVDEGFVEARQPEDVWFRIEELANGRKNQQTRAQFSFWRLATP